MKATIDKAGRLVIPAELREQAGIVPGVVDVYLSGTGLQIEVEPRGRLVEEEDGRLVIAATGLKITDEELRDLRLRDQK